MKATNNSVDLVHTRDFLRLYHRVDDASMATPGDDEKAFLKVENNSRVIPFVVLNDFSIHHRVKVLQHFKRSYPLDLPRSSDSGHQVQWFARQRENSPFLLELHLTLGQADMANPIRIDLEARSECLGMGDDRNWAADGVQDPRQPIRMVIVTVGKENRADLVQRSSQDSQVMENWRCGRIRVVEDMFLKRMSSIRDLGLARAGGDQTWVD